MLGSLLFLLVTGASAVPSERPNAEPKCGYDTCTQHKTGVLNVHIVPHTHDDVGWLKTVDQYYYGSRNDIQKAGVQYILDSVIQQLWKKPDRRFIYVETAYFWKWWNLQSEDIKQKVHTLVSEGRLKFAGGAWSMNDEATTYYQSTIDQFTYGLSKLNETFGKCGRPTVGWQIDPFGHSREFASMLAAMGYDGLFLGRIDYQDKAARMKEKRMEMIWVGDDTLGGDSAIFTSVLYNTYSAPKGFCFDVLCDDTPIIDDPNSPDYNVDEKVSEFLKVTRHMAEAYSTNNLLVTMGEDFQYQVASMWYTNLDKLIKYGNLKAAKDGLDMNLFYSTPDCYLKAVNEAEPMLPVKYDDFFPYASDPHAYWTGYYTSRPSIKYLETQTNVYLQMVKQLHVLAQLSDDYQPVIDDLKAAMGVMQHHDAVTGTEKQHVANDYVRMVSKAAAAAHAVPTAAFNKMMNVSGLGLEPLVFDRCMFNESSCATSENAAGNFIVTVYNPLAWAQLHPVHIPITEEADDYEVHDGEGNKYRTQIEDLPEPMLKIPQRKSKAKRELSFFAKPPPLGYKSYYITRIHTKSKRDLTSNKNEGISDIEAYWNNIKKPTIISKDIDLNTHSDNNDNVEKIPDLPLSEKYKYKISTDARAKSLLKSKGLRDKNVEEFEKLFEDSNAGPKRLKYFVNPYTNMDDEEMRMLADDPMVVTRYPAEEFADQGISQAEAEPHHIKTVQGNVEKYILKGGAYYYPGAIGNNMVYENRSSGAYIFRPDAVDPTDLKLQNATEIDGKIFAESRITTSNNGAFCYRTYKSEDIKYNEVDWLIGPISVADNIGKEFIIKYESNAITNGEFYADSNGRQVLNRKLNKRPDWNLTLEEPVAGNYYPIVDVAGFKNDKGDLFLNVLPDRAAGAASLQEGTVEIMLHRRLLHDDAFGVGEALNETVEDKGLVVRGTHRVFFDLNDITYKEIIENRLQPQVFVSDASELDFTSWEKLVNEYSWLESTLPDGIHLLTTEVRGTALLLRLENFLEKAKEVNLAKVLKNIEVKTVKEILLAANNWSHKKWSWNHVNKITKPEGRNLKLRGLRHVEQTDDGFKFKIKGKQIRTFVVEYERKSF